MYNFVMNFVGIFISWKSYEAQEKAELKYEKCLLQSEKCSLNTAQNSYFLEINQVRGQPRQAFANKSPQNTSKIYLMPSTNFATLYYSQKCRFFTVKFYFPQFVTGLMRRNQKPKIKEIKISTPFLTPKREINTMKSLKGISLILYLRFYLFIQSTRVGGGTGKGRESQVDSMLSVESHTGIRSHDPEIMT